MVVRTSRVGRRHLPATKRVHCPRKFISDSKIDELHLFMSLWVRVSVLPSASHQVTVGGPCTKEKH